MAAQQPLKNEAAWLTSEKAYPLQVKEAPFPEPVGDEIIIKVGAIAVNPVDYVLQESAFYPLPYPWILGTDIAGHIHALGPSADTTIFRPGDPVLALTPGFDARDPAGGAFQRFVRQRPPLVARIPPGLPLADACVVPLATGTAAAGLFEDGFLGLRLPSAIPAVTTGAGVEGGGEGEGDGGKEGGNEKDKEVLLVWGAASSVGSCAVQLARCAGYEVWGVAGEANAGYVVDGLGAARAFDYRAEGVVDGIVEAFVGRRFAGVFDAVSVGGAVEACVEVAARVGTEGRRFVASVRWLPEGLKDNLPEGVEAKWMWGSMSGKTEVGPAVFGTFLPKALEDGRFKCMPRPEVVGEGLESLQKACDVLKGGVSAKKIVVTL
ncbi:zinc-binding oxidoreductase [Diplodia corticola]|uniref:Zinc-binding oxidoreductase n=1 Tax=Diplodia corticola TaxID=236234 RepID=A0A1J9QUU4_9PEZI|nr:zinc-binding oxidoreductase [Diplodia corticola]OJD32208.1 zinc-binding oxidoreductase [Diplodia corticola]